MSFVSEFKRRKVFQVATVYAVVAWLTIQIVGEISEPLGLPPWFRSVVIILLAIGFPVALILGWAFELTPEGLVKDQPNRAERSSRSRVEYGVLTIVLLAVVWLVYRDLSGGAGPLTEQAAASLATNAAPASSYESRFLVEPESARPMRTLGVSRELALSRDGTQLAYVWNEVGYGLVVRPAADRSLRYLRGAQEARAPFFSYGGEFIGFFDQADFALKYIPVGDGPEVTITGLDSQPLGADWGEDDIIVFATERSGGLMRIDVNAEAPERVTSVDRDRGELDHRWPSILPGGAAVLFTVWTGQAGTSQIAVASVQTGEVEYLSITGTQPQYSPTGHIVFAAEGSLRMIGFDANSLTLTESSATEIVPQVFTKDSGASYFDISDEGSVVFVPGTALWGTRRSLVWVDRAGNEDRLSLEPGPYFWVRVAPDGTRIMVESSATAAVRILVADSQNSPLRHVVDGSSPLWSPDSQRIIYTTDLDPEDPEPQPAMYSILADGTELPELLTTYLDNGDVDPIVPRRFGPESWADDGQTLIFTHWPPQGSGRSMGIGKLGVGDSSWTRLIQRNYMTAMEDVSPDNKFIAYETNADSQYDVYIERYPDLGDRKAVSDADGGWGPVWCAYDGESELYYRRWSDGAMMAVRFDGGEPLPPQVLFQWDFYRRTERGGPRTFDVHPSCERFLMMKDETENPSIVWGRNLLRQEQ